MSEEIKPVGRIRTAFRDASMEIKGGVRINDLLWYDLPKKYPGEIGIHLFATKIEPSIAGAKMFQNTFEEGLRELARRMETEPVLVDITQVSAWSTLVHERPKWMRLMGFEIQEERDEKTNETLAIISREEFLERYGSK